MTIRVAINGFGRIGRLALRGIYESGRDDVKVVAINDLGDVKMNAYLLKRDSVHGKFPFDVNVDGNNIVIGDDKIAVSAERNPADLPWGDLDVDVVYECTGFFCDKDKASAHLDAGAKKVLISAPASGVSKTIVFGVNHETLEAGDKVISNASCTTNCLAPVAQVLNETVGIEKGIMTTVHAYTGDQRVLDTLHSDPLRARACGLSMIPTSTGAARAVGLVLPELSGKLDGTSIRVPTPNVSLVDLTFVAKKDTSADEINAAIKAAANGRLKGVLAYIDEPVVSIDLNHDAHSSSFDSAQTSVMDGNLVRILTWYDNEWGFANRMSDTAVVLHNVG
ncbi:type I glyceraldehyde-3-phosphate dehydrogenase [Emcibacteraceae bacterium]|jgi:glyceraldehyde 3-phosphate dehydrogenase|uniref:type I glyceraldehyde-3-phosphate dehydrogenase n=1 Tax=Pseudemcibacter sp. TaxID=2943293 RepID=UPI0023255EAC|nr:type I glyceraldehyde-3-phosphate dehydrogenase [Emcibacteraceae bacterium]MDA9771808.1 type I glyceraldehyde-3-phosphate dehydrogenase [Emcibacteraceae bacterium]